MDNKEKLLEKLFMEECTREELEFLFRMLREDPSAAAPEIMVELFRQLGQTPTMGKATSDRIFREIAIRMNSEKLAIPERDRRSGRRRHLPVWLYSAAAAVLLLLGATWLYRYGQPEKMILEQTTFNQIKEFVLPDSSSVVLNGNSSLRYLADWPAGRTRVVYLSGEAYFQVRKNPVTGIKFQVVTDDLTVEVLGTAFNVNARRAETSVFLEEGKVKVSLEDAQIREVFLEPGEVMSYSASDKKLDLPASVDTGPQTSWRTGIMEFKEAPLQVILEKLSAAHHLQFEFEVEEPPNRTFTLNLPTQDMDVAMAILSKATRLSITKREDTFFIGPPLEEKKE